MLITCTVLCVSFMGTGASHPLKRLPLSALDKDGQLDIAECDLLRTKASKLRRHDPLFPEQRRPPQFMAVGPRCPARCLTGTFCIAPRPELCFNKRLTESRGQSKNASSKPWHAWQQGGRHQLQASLSRGAYYYYYFFYYYYYYWYYYYYSRDRILRQRPHSDDWCNLKTPRGEGRSKNHGSYIHEDCTSSRGARCANTSQTLSRHFTDTCKFFTGFFMHRPSAQNVRFP